MFDFIPDWLEIGILGGLSEELAEEELERRRERRLLEAERNVDEDPEE